MAFQEAVIYRMVCDCCGLEAEYEEFWGYIDKSAAEEADENFTSIGDEHLCESCWCWPEDLPDYPGDEQWQGGDDPVRKVSCHPGSPGFVWRAPVLPASEQVAIAVGNQLRLANARFDAAMLRLQPKTLFQQLIQDLDDLRDSFLVFGAASMKFSEIMATIEWPEQEPSD